MLPVKATDSVTGLIHLPTVACISNLKDHPLAQSPACPYLIPLTNWMCRKPKTKTGISSLLLSTKKDTSSCNVRWLIRIRLILTDCMMTSAIFVLYFLPPLWMAWWMALTHAVIFWTVMHINTAMILSTAVFVRNFPVVTGWRPSMTMPTSLCSRRTVSRENVTNGASVSPTCLGE